MSGGVRQSFLADYADDEHVHVTHRTPRLAGIQVAHMRAEWDAYGGRSRNGDTLRHMNNTEPGTRGWLGNPYLMDGDTVDERRRVINAYLVAFVDRIESDPEFRTAVEDLRGDRVACWCRGVSQDRTPSNWCHLDVVAAWLNGDLSHVTRYVHGGQA